MRRFCLPERITKMSLQRTLGNEVLVIYPRRMTSDRPPASAPAPPPASAPAPSPASAPASPKKPAADVLHLDARTLRGLAHPLRMRMLGLLRADGPATATGLAARLNLSSAATSYHLRQLATYGFIVEDAGRGQPRERWWRAAHRSSTMDVASEESARAQGDPEAVEAYLRSVAAVYTAQMQAHLDELMTLPQAWQRSGTMSDQSLRLTPEQADELCERIWAVVEDYPRADAPSEQAPPDARRVTVQLQVFARPGDPL
jgi:DNA-binding transcriptional ArsR family regulator